MCKLHIYFCAPDQAKSYIGFDARGVDTGRACRHAEAARDLVCLGSPRAPRRAHPDETDPARAAPKTRLGRRAQQAVTILPRLLTVAGVSLWRANISGRYAFASNSSVRLRPCPIDAARSILRRNGRRGTSTARAPSHGSAAAKWSTHSVACFPRAVRPFPHKCHPRSAEVQASNSSLVANRNQQRWWSCRRSIDCCQTVLKLRYLPLQPASPGRPPCLAWRARARPRWWCRGRTLDRAALCGLPSPIDIHQCPSFSPSQLLR